MQYDQPSKSRRPTKWFVYGEWTVSFSRGGGHLITVDRRMAEEMINKAAVSKVDTSNCLLEVLERMS